MADVNPKVMEMVQSELKNDPDISNANLLEKAKQIDSGIGDLSARQFNARYPLQVKRAMKPTRRRKSASKSRKRKGSGGAGRGRASTSDKSRDNVRMILLELARDVANAQGKGDVVDVVMGIDGYVDRVVKARG